MALACFDTIYIIIGGINYTFHAFGYADNYAYTISFPYIIYPITNISLCGTIFMTVAISIERFLGICYPLHLPPQNRKAWYYVLPIVCLSLLVNLPKFFEAEIEWKQDDVALLDSLWDLAASNNGSRSEEYDWANERTNEPRFKHTDLRMNSNYIKYYVTYCRIFFTVIIPFIALLTINLRIIADLHKLKSKPFGSQRKLWKEVNMFMVLLSIVIIFICCSTPRTIIDIWEFYHLEAIVTCKDLYMEGESLHLFLPERWIECLTHVSHFTTILNSSINFLVYCLVGHNFRKQLLVSLGLRTSSQTQVTELVSLTRESCR